MVVAAAPGLALLGSVQFYCSYYYSSYCFFFRNLL